MEVRFPCTDTREVLTRVGVTADRLADALAQDGIDPDDPLAPPG